MTLPVFTPMILLWTSPSLTGPWKRHVLYTVPAPYNDLDRYKFYAAKLHPELTPPHRYHTTTTHRPSRHTVL